LLTIDQLIRDRASDTRVGLAYSDRTWTHDEVVRAQAERSAILLAMRQPGPFHVALLMDNVPEYVFWMGAAALAGAVVVGGNPTHRGDELARDLSHTECQLLVTNPTYRKLVEGHHLGPALPPERILVVDDPTGDVTSGSPSEYGTLLAGVAGAHLPDQEAVGVTEESLGLLLFTSGTSGAPKACLCSQGRLARIGSIVAQMYSITDGDVCYMAMPLFHSNALMAGWAPALAAGATAALRERFSASQFVVDVRRYGVTYFNYVGKPLSYILATPALPDDADNTLRQCFGNEAAEADVATFAERFDCAVQDAYGSTEGGAAVQRTPDTPRGALGRALPGTIIIDTDSGEECPRAAFDERGRLLNAEQAIGEMVSLTGATGFEGYWRNAEAEAARVKNGWYWTGDLAYRDADDFFYFAGRDYDWLRVDGENFASAPVESILQRHPDVLLASVYAVPDTVVGDQVMATVLLHEGRSFDPDGFQAFLDGEEDLGTKWAPKFFRVTDQLPETATTKVMKRVLRTESWHCDEPVWWRPVKDAPYRRLEAADIEELDHLIAER
jgi:fatty-acyl-CoA synthase